MARADLLQEYSGWQALDATCQEKSTGKASKPGLGGCGERNREQIKQFNTPPFPSFQWKDAKGQGLTLLTLSTKSSFMFGLCSLCSSKSSITAP